MRRHSIRLALVGSALLAGGCATVFGISDGELDPDPFGQGPGDAAVESSLIDSSPPPPPSEAGLPEAASAPDATPDAPSLADASDAAHLDAGPPPCTALIDDLEDGDGWIIRCLTRGGPWYTYNDGTAGGTQTPLPGRPFLPDTPGYMSKYAAHTKGSGFTSRGAGMGFDLNNPAGKRATYDASAYKGLTFWARSTSSPLHMYVNFPDRDTDPAGGVCTTCNDSFGKGIDITTTWAQYTVLFSTLSTDGIGMPAPKAFDPAHVYSIEFHTPFSTVFDFWVDDIAFTP